MYLTMDDKEIAAAAADESGIDSDGGGPEKQTSVPLLPPKPRPHITLKIPAVQQQQQQQPQQRPMSFYYGSPVVTIPMTPVNGQPGVTNTPFSIPLVQAYPNKASEFMFKQFEGEWHLQLL